MMTKQMLGKWLKSERLRLNLSAAALSKDLDLNLRSIYAYEHGARSMSHKHLQKFVECGASASMLLRGQPGPRISDSSIDEMIKTVFELRATGYWKKLDNEERFNAARAHVSRLLPVGDRRIPVPTNGLGAWLRSERRRLNLSASALANYLGVDQSSIYNYERGVRKMLHEHLQKFVEHGASEFMLLKGEPNPTVWDSLVDDMVKAVFELIATSYWPKLDHDERFTAARAYVSRGLTVAGQSLA